MILRAYTEEAAQAMVAFAVRAPERVREALGVRLSVHQVATALLFLDESGRVRRQRSLTPASRSSYLLKHVCENWGRAHGFEPYVSSADFVAAALYRGVQVEQHHRGPNFWLALRLVRRAPPTARASRQRPQLSLVQGGAA